jgi:hypothetical protein
MDAIFQAGRLVAQRRAADQRQHLDVVFKARQTADFLRHLIGQFARRAEHHGLHGKVLGVQLVEQGRPKAAVLPLPVLACAIRSWPASAIGRLAA